MKRFLKITGILLAVIVGILLAAVCFFTLTEYRPADREVIVPEGSASGVLRQEDSFTVLSWNLGYAALGDNADYWQDGGKHVITSTEERVTENLQAIRAFTEERSPDVIFFQETDRKADRTYGIDEVDYLNAAFPGMESGYAINFKVLYFPAPIPPIGNVESGLMTLSSFRSAETDRVQLPLASGWPISLINTKRCLLVTRIPVVGSKRELVLINLHLEAYDSGEGKIRQTRFLQEFLSAEAEKGNYVIAGGDFNQTFSSNEGLYPVFPGTWQPGRIDLADFSAWQAVSDPSVPTCRSLDIPYLDSNKAGFQFYVIDGFLVSRNLTVESCKTYDLQFRNSDHNPVLLRVTLQDLD